jgi:hypothetical protein
VIEALLVLTGVVIGALVVAFLLRRRFLLSGLGAVTMWLRSEGSPRWSVGVGWYGGDTLLWYRGLSLSVRPQRRLRRAGFSVESRRGAGRDDHPLPRSSSCPAGHAPGRRSWRWSPRR